MNKIIGVLWKREKNGKEYYSGVLNDLRGKINIAIFPNTFKQADNQPDMNIVISWSNPGEKKDSETNNKKTTANKKRSSRKKKDAQKTDDDEVPF